MQLLVSVADVRDARAALAGGADLIDAKEPRRGALGAVAPERLRAICEAVGAHRPVSAALGDATDTAHIGRATRAAVAASVTYVKIGFRGAGSPARVRQLAIAAGAGTGAGGHLIMVGYADWDRVDAPRPEMILEVAAAVSAAGVLLDTAIKDATLFERMPHDNVATWVASAHAAGLLVALAGSLRGTDLRAAGEAGADIVGVRGAACDGGRTGRVSVARVAALSALAGSAPMPRPGALV